MAPVLATNRLRKELIRLQKEPLPGIIATPDETNILVWYYAIRGPIDTPYHGGIYVGKLKFPTEYPMKGPSISMLTPSGRFQINTKICMSMSGDFHPESWNPMWSVSSIIQGIQSFMATNELTTGGITTTPITQIKKYATSSIDYNKKHFATIFDSGNGNSSIEELLNQADELYKENEKKNAATKTTTSSSAATRGSRRRKTTRSTTPKSVEATKDEDAENDDDGDEAEGEEKEVEESKQSTTELTPEEIEKRRKKNAKKRAKQKAKKKQQQQQQQQDQQAEVASAEPASASTSVSTN